MDAPHQGGVRKPSEAINRRVDLGAFHT